MKRFIVVCSAILIGVGITNMALSDTTDDQSPMLSVSLWQGSDPPANEGDEDDSQATVYQTAAHRQQTKLQTICVQAGQYAMLAMRHDIPLQTIDSGYSGYGVHTQYKTVTDYLHIQPSLIGEKVQIVLREQNSEQSTANQLEVKSQQIDTKMIIPLDKWVLVAGHASSDDSDNVTYTTQIRSNVNTNYYIKIQLANDDNGCE